MKLSDLINFQSNRSRLDEIRKNRKDIIPFVGAGISKSCGLYTWGELLDILAADYLTTKEINLIKEKGDFFEYADRIVMLSGNSDMVMKKIREIFAQIKVTNTEIPYLLGTMFSPMLVTTNYDTLLEDSSKHSSMGPLKPLLPCLEGQMNESIQTNARCVLKLHGSVEETQSFVFTSDQYRRFYGSSGHRESKLNPAYLMKIFSSKKVLFVGCSLDKDYTLDILEECVKENKSISHYAIVPYPCEKAQQIEKNRYFTRLGIEPIYYPEGDYKAVDQLINYLAEENHFILLLKRIIFENFTHINDEKIHILISLVKESFYKTAFKHPQLIDIDNTKIDYIKDCYESIDRKRNQSDTILSICKLAFYTYIKSGYLRCEEEIANYFSQQLESVALKETQIEELLEKKWSIERNLSNSKEYDIVWITSLSDDEINRYAIDLIQKLQYRNGMNFADIFPAYELAKKFVELIGNRLEFNIRTRLLNSIGGFGHYFKDSEGAIKCLEQCINEINASGSKDRNLMLFQAKCYANLAITRSLSNYDISLAVEDAEKDIFLKKEYGESDILYSRSLNFYATVLKEMDPFKACEIYLEAADMKEALIKKGTINEEVKEFTASWATTVFNIGLLAKDLELYDLAYRIICYANKYRFEIIDYCNRDYCSSVNIRAELELFVHEKDNLEWLINGIESRVDLPKGFAETLAHTWYVCSLYYYFNGDYLTAIKYVNKSIGVSKKKGALTDFRQDMRTLLLLGDIKAVDDWEQGEKIYIDVVDRIKSLYGNDSYYLLLPYRRLAKGCRQHESENKYELYYNELKKKYLSAVEMAESKLEKYIERYKM